MSVYTQDLLLFQGLSPLIQRHEGERPRVGSSRKEGNSNLCEPDRKTKRKARAFNALPGFVLTTVRLKRRGFRPSMSASIRARTRLPKSTPSPYNGRHD